MMSLGAQGERRRDEQMAVLGRRGLWEVRTGGIHPRELKIT